MYNIKTKRNILKTYTNAKNDASQLPRLKAAIAELFTFPCQRMPPNDIKRTAKGARDRGKQKKKRERKGKRSRRKREEKRERVGLLATVNCE